jgi:hypothetical protein
VSAPAKLITSTRDRQLGANAVVQEFHATRVDAFWGKPIIMFRCLVNTIRHLSLTLNAGTFLDLILEFSRDKLQLTNFSFFSMHPLEQDYRFK